MTVQAVLEGKRVKYTLERQRVESQSLVRIDWLRFTLPLGAIVKMEDGRAPDAAFIGSLDKSAREVMVRCLTYGVDKDYTGACFVAERAAQMLCDKLGGFPEAWETGAVEDRSMDYYAARCAVQHESATVGYVLAGAKGKNENSSRQAATVHFNLFGEALLHVSHAQLAKLADWIEGEGGWVTRVDLACDIFEGRSIAEIRQAYLDGEFDVRGKRPKQEEHGCWTNGHSRSFYVGSRETGKLLRGYEKGDQLFGPEAKDEWLRVEVEFRNNHRVIDVDVLRRPADFFAGAYGYCARLLAELSAQIVEAERIATHARTASKTAEAAVQACTKWLDRIAGPTLRAAWDMGGDVLILEILKRSESRQPRRLASFGRQQLRAAFDQVSSLFAASDEPLCSAA